MHFVRGGSGWMACAGLAFGLAAATVALSHRAPPPDGLEALVPEAREAVVRINRERQNQNLLSLKLNPELTRAAQAHAEDMAKRGYFSHQCPEGKWPADRLKQVGYQGPVAENILAGEQSAREVVQAWMDSPPHRRNILEGRYREVGVGFAKNAEGRGYWVMDFSVRKDVFPVVLEADSASARERDVQVEIYGEGVFQRMRLWEPGQTPGAWEPFAPRRRWTFAGDPGVRQLIVEREDSAGIVVRTEVSIRVSTDGTLSEQVRR